MTPALFRIGVIYAKELHDREKARGAFHRLYADFTTSNLRADALWFEASLWAEDGDTKTSCARLDTLTGDFPDSRYVPCAIDKCPAIKRREKSKAPKECHPYLLRTDRFVSLTAGASGASAPSDSGPSDSSADGAPSGR
jgi:hypothetical protein